MQKGEKKEKDAPMLSSQCSLKNLGWEIAYKLGSQSILKVAFIFD